jgi:hypothetical protein
MKPPPSAALPFLIRRDHEVVSGEDVTSTEETHYGLLRLYNDELLVQWRTSREINRYGEEVRTDHEFEPIREVTIPVGGIAGAVVRRKWHRGWRRRVFVLTAADLRTFDDLTGKEGVPGLVMKHPAELVLELRKSDVDRAREFASKLALAVSEEMLRALREDEHDAWTPESLPTNHHDEEMPPEQVRTRSGSRER